MANIMEFFTGQFNGPVSVPMILISLLVSFAVSLYIIFIYRKTFNGIVYNRSLPLCILLLSMVTAMIIRTINSNLSLSLGMVGALSIVRFRTAIKDPVDTAFMFWAITAGIMSGANLYFISIVGSLLLGVIYYLYYLSDVKAKTPYLLIVRYEAAAEERLADALAGISRRNLRSKSVNENGMCEVTYEIERLAHSDSILLSLQQVRGVQSVNLVSYQNDFGM